MPNDKQRIEIITGRERRRRYTAHEKVRFVEETMQPGMTVSAVARIHGLLPSLLFGWRRRMAEGGQVAVQADDEVVAASRMRALEARVRDLERLLGRKTLEVEVLKEALAAAVAARGLFPVKVMADALGVARSNLVEQIRSGSRSLGPYHRADDEAVLIAIRAITDVRPTYSYRRMTAILNRTRRATGEPADTTGQGASEPQAPTPAPAPAPAAKRVSGLIVYLFPEDHDRLRDLAHLSKTSLQQLGIEAWNLLLEKRGHPPLSPTTANRPSGRNR